MRAVSEAGDMVDDQHIVCDTAARYLVCRNDEPWAGNTCHERYTQ